MAILVVRASKRARGGFRNDILDARCSLKNGTKAQVTLSKGAIIEAEDECLHPIDPDWIGTPEVIRRLRICLGPSPKHSDEYDMAYDFEFNVAFSSPQRFWNDDAEFNAQPGEVFLDFKDTLQTSKQDNVSPFNQLVTLPT